MLIAVQLLKEVPRLEGNGQAHYRIRNSLTFVIVRRHKSELHIPTAETTPEITWVISCSLGFVSRFISCAFCGSVVLLRGAT